MNITQDEIYTFKVVSGEEFVAKIVRVDDGVLVIRNPVSTGVTPQGLQMMPSLLTANMDRDVLLYSSSIVMVSSTREDVQASYIKATTGIDVPPKKSIITG
jgi:hypothetical protein